MTSVSTDRRLGVNSGAALKVPCRAASTGNLTLSGEQTIDGIACVTGDRVLVKNQTSGAGNGIYIVDTGTWGRAPDWDGAYDVVTGTAVYITSGSSNSGTYWAVTTTGTITVGTTSVAFANAVISSAASITFIQSGTGALATDLQTRGRLVVYVTDFGADTAATDNATAFANAITRVANAGRVVVPSGTWKLASSVTIPKGVELVGFGKDNTILQFTGATDGLTITDSSVTIYARVSDLQVQTTSASGGKGIYFNTAAHGASHCLLQNVEISYSGSGRWAYGLWASNFQTSEIRSLRVYQSATIGIHLEYGCNAGNWYNVEVVGSSGAGTITRGVEITDGGVTFETQWFGGTIQGYFTQSCFNSTGCAPKVYGFHFENTNATPSDGADILVNGTAVNASFVGLQGGSLLTSGTLRNLHISGGEMNAITLAASSLCGSVIGVRAASITDSAQATTIIGCSDASGNLLSSKIYGALVAGSTTAIPTAGSPDSAGFLAAANNAYLTARDTSGVYQEILLPLSSSDDTFLQCKTGQTLHLRAATTAKLTVNVNGVTVKAARFLEIQGAVLTAANNLALGADGNYFQVNGATQINLIDNGNWQGGASVTLKFNSTPTVKHNQAASGNNKPIILNGAVDFVAAINNTLTVRYDSTDAVWYEQSRKV